MSRSKISAIPSHVQSLSEVSPRDLPLYESARTNGFELNQPGRLLSRYRKAMAENPTGAPPSARWGQEPKLSPDQWKTLLAVAHPSERPFFLQEVANGRIKVEGSSFVRKPMAKA